MKPNQRTKPRISKPAIDARGACLACASNGGWVCDWHKEESAQRDRDLSAMFVRVSASNKANRIAEVCSRFELESDEMLTREEKAELMIQRGQA